MGLSLSDSVPNRGLGRARSAVALTLGLLGVALFPTLACTPDADKNYDERARVATDQLDPGCIDQCLHVAEGSPVAPPVDCAAAEEGIEFYPLPIWDFEGGLGSNMYTYTDNSSAFLDPNGWEPRAETATRCEGRPDDQVLHIRGGPFVDWGGGLGRDLKCLNHSPELGAFKLAELGIEPEDYLNYTLTDAAVINSTCDTSADCRPGLDCVLDGTTNRCLAPQCTSNDDCTVPGWYCPPPGDDPSAARRCQRYVTDRSCGEAPSWVMPETGTRYSAESEGACRQGNDASDDPLYLQYRSLIESACPERDREAILAESSLDSGDEEFMLGMTLDMSEWEGVSFWARRTVDSQAGIRIAVGDKFTDDDLSYQQFHVNPESELYCKRNRECGLKAGSTDTCLDQRSCIRLNTARAGQAQTNPQECGLGGTIRDGVCVPIDICFDPETDLVREGWTCAETDGVWECDEVQDDAALTHQRCADDCTGIGNCVRPDECPAGHKCSTYDFGATDDPADDVRYCWNTLWDQVPSDEEHEFPVCGDSACDFFYRPFQKADAQFYGTTCQDFSFAGGITRGYCYDPEDEDTGPFESQFVCGDHWIKPVYLSDQWRFYTIPFKELLQQGWAKEAHEFDLTSLAVIRMTWDRGWVDYYIDDVRFYRYK